MRKFSVFLLALTLILFTSGMASALTLQSVDGEWTDWVGGSSVITTTASVAYGNTNEDQIRWGTGPSGQSGLGFTGVVPDPGFLAFNPGDPFEIGQLRHFNNPIGSSNQAASTAELTVDLDFASGSGSFIFDFGIDETPNTGAGCCDDFIFFPMSVPEQSIDLGPNGKFFLELLGFGPDDETFVSQFQSPEGSTNETLVWARLNPIPEPATVLLLGSGLLGLTAIGRKKFFKKS